MVVRDVDFLPRSDVGRTCWRKPRLSATELSAETCPCKWDHTWSEKVTRRPTSPTWIDYKNQLQKLILLAGSHDCNARRPTLYGRKSSFVASAADYFGVPVSYARCPSNFCGMCSDNFACFFFGKRTTFFSKFLIQKWPTIPDFLIKFMDTCYVYNCDSGKFVTKFSPTLSRGTTFHTPFIHKSAVQNEIEPCPQTQKPVLHCCVNNFSSSRCFR